MADEAPNEDAGTRRGRSPALRWIAAVVALVAIAGTAAYVRSRSRESTDDAQVDGHITYVSARIGGTVRKVLVTDNQLVEAGAVLVEIDPADFRVAVDRARAELAKAEADAQAARAGVPIAQTTTLSQVVQAGQPLCALVDLDGVWVTANFKETQLRHMKPGQSVSISVDALGSTISGHVDSSGSATGARFSLLPPDNATGNFVKVVQRVPVKIVLDQGQNADRRLRPGLSVVPTVTLQ
jgi:multidrug resistance efflux pump